MLVLADLVLLGLAVKAKCVGTWVVGNILYAVGYWVVAYRVASRRPE